MQGTITISVRTAPDRLEAAVAALQAAGIEAGIDSRGDRPEVEAGIHYGDSNPGADLQREAMDRVHEVLTSAGIDFEHASHGVAIGGSSEHRWVDVVDLATGQHVVKVMAADEAEARRELERVAETLRVDPALLALDLPEEWHER